MAKNHMQGHPGQTDKIHRLDGDQKVAWWVTEERDLKNT